MLLHNFDIFLCNSILQLQAVKKFGTNAIFIAAKNGYLLSTGYREVTSESIGPDFKNYLFTCQTVILTSIIYLSTRLNIPLINAQCKSKAYH